MMKRKEYRGHAFELWCAGKVSDEVYDAMLMNEDAFCEDDDDWDERFPESYCEIEYADTESEEAARGCAFDDMNYLRHFER